MTPVYRSPEARAPATATKRLAWNDETRRGFAAPAPASTVCRPVHPAGLCLPLQRLTGEVIATLSVAHRRWSRFNDDNFHLYQHCAPRTGHAGLPVARWQGWRREPSPRVRAVRQLGMLWAWDIDDGGVAGFSSAYHLAAREQGLLLRPIGNTLYFMPPYVLDDGALEQLASGAPPASPDAKPATRSRLAAHPPHPCGGHETGGRRRHPHRPWLGQHPVCVPPAWCRSRSRYPGQYCRATIDQDAAAALQQLAALARWSCHRYCPTPKPAPTWPSGWRRPSFGLRLGFACR